jgi:hypothetical protein
MLTIDSDGCRPPVPAHGDQLFQRMAPVFSGVPESVDGPLWNPAGPILLSSNSTQDCGFVCPKPALILHNYAKWAVLNP